MSSSNTPLLYTVGTPNGHKASILLEELKDAYGFQYDFQKISFLHYDKERKFSYDPVQDPDLYSEQLQWIFFTHGGIGPMQGQANHFYRYAPEKIPYGINRYINETKRLYSVLNDRLTDRDYLVGPGKGKYGLADINSFPWVSTWRWAGVDSLEAFPNVEAWLKRISDRPQVKSGLDVPEPQGPPLTKEEEEEAAEGARKWILQPQK
ncbi:glutathione S-transferase, carboxy-terminal domain protein, putative, partial [Rhizoctonia solani AG-3 Rhs1AP]